MNKKLVEALQKAVGELEYNKYQFEVYLDDDGPDEDDFAKYITLEFNFDSKKEGHINSDKHGGSIGHFKVTKGPEKTSR